MKTLISMFALVSLALPGATADAREGKAGNIHFSGKTIWTNKNDLTEIVRFPLRSDDPSFIVYLESLHPEDSDCSRDEQDAGDCQRPDLCHIWVEVRRDLQPVRSEPIQSDQSRVLITWLDEETRDGNGRHMNPHLDFGILVEARNGEALWFHGPIIMRYAAGNQQCMAGVKVEYHRNTKNIFNQWRGPQLPR